MRSLGKSLKSLGQSLREALGQSLESLKLSLRPLEEALGLSLGSGKRRQGNRRGRWRQLILAEAR